MQPHTPQTVVLIGRMNVGKSTLFNRLVDGSRAIVSPHAGTTRDRKEGTVMWGTHTFTLVDTGGIDTLKTKHKHKEEETYHESSEFFAEEIQRQTNIALAIADIILFLVDGREGLMPQERTIARTLKKMHKPVLLVVNKTERKVVRENLHEFWILGFGTPHPISALTGVGTGDLLDEITALLERGTKKQKEDPHNDTRKSLRCILIGKPNVGKSTLVNALLKEERMITSPIAHTTREPIELSLPGQTIPTMLIDTAGIRKQRNVGPGLEKAGVTLSLKELDRIDVALLMLEGHKPLGTQDLRLGQEIATRNTGVAILVNKWDIFKVESRKHAPYRTGGSGAGSKVSAKGGPASGGESQDVTKKYTAYLRRQMPHLAFAPILFISAKTGHRVGNILPLMHEIQKERERLLPDDVLASWLTKLVYRQSTKNKKAKKPYVYGIRQTGTCPPAFTVTTEWTTIPTKKGKQKGTVRDSYIHFLENRLRATFGFEGTPIVVQLRTLE